MKTLQATTGLPTAVVADLCNVTPEKLKAWVAEAFIVPVQIGKQGRGSSHMFSAMQTLGLVVAARDYFSERGSRAAYVGRVVSAFEAVTADWLEGQFADGLICFATVYQDRPVLSPELFPNMTDVRNCYQIVQQLFAEAASA